MYALAEAPDKGIPHDHIATSIIRGPSPKSPTKTWWENFGENIATRQKKANLSDQQLAQQAGISPKTLGRIKTGSTTPTYSTLRGLTKALRFKFTIAGYDISISR